MRRVVPFLRVKSEISPYFLGDFAVVHFSLIPVKKSACAGAGVNFLTPLCPGRVSDRRPLEHSVGRRQSYLDQLHVRAPSMRRMFVSQAVMLNILIFNHIARDRR